MGGRGGCSKEREPLTSLPPMINIGALILCACVMGLRSAMVAFCCDVYCAKSAGMSTSSPNTRGWR